MEQQYLSSQLILTQCKLKLSLVHGAGERSFFHASLHFCSSVHNPSPQRPVLHSPHLFHLEQPVSHVSIVSTNAYVLRTPCSVHEVTDLLPNSTSFFDLNLLKLASFTPAHLPVEWWSCQLVNRSMDYNRLLTISIKKG